MALTTLIFVTTVLITKMSGVAQAQAASGDSFADFAALCGLITLAETTIAAKTDATQTNNLLQTINAINITLAGDAITAVLVELKNKKWSELTKDQTKGKEGWKLDWDRWAEATAYAQQEANKPKFEVWKSVRGKQATKAKVVHLAAKANELAMAIPELRAKLTTAQATEELQKALIGDDLAKSGLKASGSDRVAACGPRNSPATDDGGADAGKSLLLDLLCLCGGHTTDTGAGKACCSGCEGLPNNANWVTNNDAKATAEFLAKQCPKATRTTCITSSAVEGAWARFLTRVSTPKGNAKAYENAIGILAGTGESGCDGHKNSNGGPCVKYGKKQVVTGEEPPKWLEHLRTAAQLNEEADSANRQIKSIERQLQGINVTLGTLLWDEAKAVKITAPGTGDEKLDENDGCASHKSNSTCTADNNCKWQGIAEEKGTCKPKEGEGQKNSAGTGTGTAGTST